jgi:hypothetical protein
MAQLIVLNVYEMCDQSRQYNIILSVFIWEMHIKAYGDSLIKVILAAR